MRTFEVFIKANGLEHDVILVEATCEANARNRAADVMRLAGFDVSARELGARVVA